MNRTGIEKLRAIAIAALRRSTRPLTDISGGFIGEPESVEQFIARILADPKERRAIEQLGLKMRCEQDGPA